jgi:hypothetical protein
MIGCFDSCAGVDRGKAAGKVEDLVNTGPHATPAPAVNEPLVVSYSPNAAENGVISERPAVSDLRLRRANQHPRSPSMSTTVPPTTPAIKPVLPCFPLALSAAGLGGRNATVAVGVVVVVTDRESVRGD